MSRLRPELRPLVRLSGCRLSAAILRNPNMPSKNRYPRSVVISATLYAVSAIVLLGCSNAPDEKGSQETAPRQGAEKPTAPVAELAGKAVQPQAMPVEPAAKIAGDAAAMPPAPKVSTFAPAKDLADQADQYIKSLTKSVAAEEDYKDDQGKIAKESNTLVIIALALGLHDQESKYKARAGALMKAAQAVAATKDYPSAKKAVAALQDATKGASNADVQLKWEKVASLAELMKQVPLINNKLKRAVKPEKFKKKAKDSAGYTAVIAAIAQGSMANSSETKKPEQVKQWCDLAAAMRDDAGALNAAINKGDEPAAAKAMKKLQQGCEDCHAVFHPEAIEKSKSE
jgi:hypothetical protein